MHTQGNMQIITSNIFFFFDAEPVTNLNIGSPYNKTQTLLPVQSLYLHEMELNYHESTL